MKQRVLYPILAFVYLIVGIVATAGAINHSIDSHENIYLVAGAMNIVFVVASIYDTWKNKIKIDKQ